jgi:hypothetical protein
MVKKIIDSRGGTKDFVVSHIISSNYMKLRIDADVTLFNFMRANFPLTLWISSSCGLCTNVFHSVIYILHTPICGRLLRIGEKKRRNLNIMSLSSLAKKFSCLWQWRQYLSQSKMLIIGVFWFWMQNICFIMILSYLQTYFIMPSCYFFSKSMGNYRRKLYKVVCVEMRTFKIQLGVAWWSTTTIRLGMQLLHY